MFPDKATAGVACGSPDAPGLTSLYFSQATATICRSRAGHRASWPPHRLRVAEGQNRDETFLPKHHCQDGQEWSQKKSKSSCRKCRLSEKESGQAGQRC